MTTALKVLAKATLVVLILDFLAYCAWAFSGQVPPDSAFAGIITKTVLSFLF